MKYVIVKTNGKVVQYWDDNLAAWGFLVSGINSDISWDNFGNKPAGRIETPRYFDSFGQAKWYLRKRNERIPKFVAERDKGWTFGIVTVIEDGDL